MTSKPIRRLRPIIYPILFFFCWTNLGIYNIAYAAANGSGQGSVAGGQQKAKSTEEKFQESLERIKDGVEHEDHQKIKTERAELEKQDLEIKKQFEETESKIKEMPEEIKKRHRDFVKKYEENLSTLKGHLDGIEKAKNKAEEKVEVEKAKAFLEKTKPPKRHVPLDPNKLPHRTVEPKFKDLRTKPEEFGPQSSQSTQSTQRAQIPLDPPLLKAEGFKNVGWAAPTNNVSPILVAANGPLTGLVSELPTYQQNTLLALNTIDLPTPADLSQTIEVQFTPDINAKAQELNYNSVKIYEWVRNNIEYVPTYGSIQGADMCLQTKQCNDMDTASLLIALLRASNISARYVYGTIELPIDKVMNWVGGFTNEQAAVNFIASGGIPIKAYASGGKIAKVQMEHVWVDAYVDMIPSGGAVHKQGDTWVPIDSSYKQYTYTQGIDVKSAVPFDAQSFVNQLKSTATINETEGYVTNVNNAFVLQSMQDYQTRVQNYITQSYSNATVGDVLGKKDIAKQVFPYFLGTLPYKTIVKGAKYAELPDSLRHKITFSVVKDYFDAETGIPINITKSLPEIAGKKITLSYSPATAQDEATINSYLPAPHADGTPIQPSELPSSFPAYLINLKPELRINEQLVATGTSVTMGSPQPFTMSLNEPGYGISNIDNIITAGEYFGIGLDTGRIGTSQLNALKTKLETTKAKLEAQSYTGITKDDIVGDLLYATIASYFAELDMNDEATARTMGVIRCRATSLGMFSTSLSVQELFGVPLSASQKGLMMDVDHVMQTVFGKDGSMNKVRQYMVASGIQGSAYEHIVPMRMFSTDVNSNAMSAVKALQIANNQGIPIYTINQSNLNAVLPYLQINSNTIEDIKNAVNAGKIVTVSKQYIVHNNAPICGYIVMDPTTGAGAYMISGGQNGALLYTSLAIAMIPVYMESGIVLGTWGGLLNQAELEIAKRYTGTPENCSHYGDWTSFYMICLYSDNNELFNVIRYGLKKEWLENGGYSQEWLWDNHPKWWIYSVVVMLGNY